MTLLDLTLCLAVACASAVVLLAVWAVERADARLERLVASSPLARRELALGAARKAPSAARSSTPIE